MTAEMNTPDGQQPEQRLCIRRVLRWLGQQKERWIKTKEMCGQLCLKDEDLRFLVEYLKNAGWIENISKIGERVVQFSIKPSITATEQNLAYCPGYGKPPTKNPVPRDQIFIVHGRDRNALEAVVKYLQSIGLTPITFQEALKMAETLPLHIDDVLAVGMAKAYAAIVLFTGDEMAQLKPEFKLEKEGQGEVKLQPQPRQNVIFEAGMAMALFGERAIFVQYGQQL